VGSRTTTIAPARHAFEYWLIQYRRWWRVGLLLSFLNPALYLAAMGVGLGGLVDRGAGAGALGGHSYLSYLAPGLLAATAMQTAVGESTWPIGNAVRWNRAYVAMVATPLRAVDVMVGHLFFVAFRLALGAAAFLLVAGAFGALASPLALLAWPAAVLCGLTHAALASAFSVGRKHDHAYASLQRFVVVPMFLFSGVFFPVTQLPWLLRDVAWLTPLWHGVALCRDLCLGEARPVGCVGHLACLAGWLVLGAALAARAHDRTLTG
jgi:lipooligosaccharide transport system permease protein